MKLLEDSQHFRWSVGPKRWARALIAPWFVVSAAVASLSCSGGSDERPDWVDTGRTETEAAGPCEPGTEQHCSVTQELSNGAAWCYHGKQICYDGIWGECTDGELQQQIVPDMDQLEAEGMSLSMATKCTSNPCDPNCQNFIEDPTDIIVTGGSGTPTLPMLTTCSHGLCTEGAGLDSACDPCATSICAHNSACCNTGDPAAWDADCTGAVGPICTGAAPTVGLCDFGVFGETSVSLQRGSEVNDGSIGAGTSVSLQEVDTAADIFSGGSVSLNDGNASGSIYFNSMSVTELNSPTYRSEVTYGGVTVAAPTVPTRTFSCLSTSGVNHDTGGSTLTVSPGDNDQYTINNTSGQVVLDGPGSYGNILFNADGELIFASGGTYRFRDLNITANSPTLLFPPGEKVIIETCSGLTIQNGATTSTHATSVGASPCASWRSWGPGQYWANGEGAQYLGKYYTTRVGPFSHPSPSRPGTSDTWTSTYWNSEISCPGPTTYSDAGSPPAAFDVEWYTNSTGTVTLGPGAIAGGVLLAPHATVAPQTGTFNGLIYAETITGNTDFIVNATGLTGAACEAAGIATAPASSSECPVDVMPPVFNEPCVTGRDCQVNHRCEEPETGATCDHSKCAPGDPLNSGCDECVERICDVDSTCCSDEWTTDCVDMVATICDATCDGYACIHNACDEGAPLDKFACDSCITDVCNTSGLETCCTDDWTVLCTAAYRSECSLDPTVTPPTDGGSFCDYSLYGGDQTTAFDSTLIGGWVGAPTSASSFIYRSNVTGHVTASASLNVTSSTISGDLMSGSGSFATFGATYGSLISSTPPTPALPAWSGTGCEPSGTVTLSGDLPPGSYRDVVVPDGATLRLSGGEYRFRSLRVGSIGGTGANLELPANDVVKVEVCGRIDFREHSDITGIPTTNAYAAMFISRGYILARGQNNLVGIFVSRGTAPAPNPCPAGCSYSYLQEGMVFLDSYVNLHGLVLGEKRADVRPYTTINSSSTEDFCEILWDPGTSTSYPTCPDSYSPTLPNESGTCTENTTGYTDSTCSGYDLAVGIACDTDIPICNHGTSSFTGTVELGYWDVSHEELSNPTPSAPDGTCSQAMTIAAGQCENLSCTTIPAGTHTIMVDPNDSLSECDGRRLDNWGLFDGSSCSSIATRTEVHRYEAVCPDESYPAWGLLTWDTETLGDSTIEFSATTAPTEAAFPMSPTYTALGVAEAAPVDTQVLNLCGTPGPLPCHVDLTAALGLTGMQDPWLEMEIVMTSGTGSPTLRDWRVTYTCIVDQ